MMKILSMDQCKIFNMEVLNRRQNLALGSHYSTDPIWCQYNFPNSLAPSFLRRFTFIGFVSDMCEKGLSDMVKYLFT